MRSCFWCSRFDQSPTLSPIATGWLPTAAGAKDIRSDLAAYFFRRRSASRSRTTLSWWRVTSIATFFTRSKPDRGSPQRRKRVDDGVYFGARGAGAEVCGPVPGGYDGGHGWGRDVANASGNHHVRSARMFALESLPQSAHRRFPAATAQARCRRQGNTLRLGRHGADGMTAGRDGCRSPVGNSAKATLSGRC
jgi:hypothetical protein